MHCSGMHPENCDGVVMTLMFRHVTAAAIVDRNTHHFVNPPNCDNIAEFDEAQDRWMNDNDVVLDQVALAAKVQAYHSRTNN